MIEACSIAYYNIIPQQVFFPKISLPIGKIILKEFKIHTKDYLPFLLTFKTIKRHKIRFSNHKNAIYLKKNSIRWHDAIWIYQPVILGFFSHTTSPDENFQLNQNLFIIIISHTKIILIKNFAFQKKIEVETRWQINKPSNNFLSFYLFYVYIYVEKLITTIKVEGMIY